MANIKQLIESDNTDEWLSVEINNEFIESLSISELFDLKHTVINSYKDHVNYQTAIYMLIDRINEEIVNRCFIIKK